MHTLKFTAVTIAFNPFVIVFISFVVGSFDDIPIFSTWFTTALKVKEKKIANLS